MSLRSSQTLIFKTSAIRAKSASVESLVACSVRCMQERVRPANPANWSCVIAADRLASLTAQAVAHLKF